MKFKGTANGSENTNLVPTPPKNFPKVKRIRTTPFNPFKKRSRVEGQPNRWTSFKNYLMMIPRCCK